VGLKEMYYLPLKAADATLNIIKATAAEAFPLNPFKFSLTSFVPYKRCGAGNHKKKIYITMAHLYSSIKGCMHLSLHF